MKKSIQLLLILSLGATFLISCEWQNDATQDYEWTEGLVPEYEQSEIRVQYYLDPNSVELKVRPKLRFPREKDTSFEIKASVDFIGIENLNIQVVNLPDWARFEAHDEKLDTWILSGNPPEDFIASGENESHPIKLILVPGPNSLPQVVDRLKYYETEKIVNLVLK